MRVFFEHRLQGELNLPEELRDAGCAQVEGLSNLTEHEIFGVVQSEDGLLTPASASSFGSTSSIVCSSLSMGRDSESENRRCASRSNSWYASTDSPM